MYLKVCLYSYCKIKSLESCFLTLVGVQSTSLKISGLFFVFSHSSRILRLAAMSLKLERKGVMHSTFIFNLTTELY